MSNRHRIRIGTRGSRLAIWQAEHVLSGLHKLHPALGIDLVPILTSGDRIQNKALRAIGGKALFVKEIEKALLENEIDLAVHSVKDLPAKLPDDLVLATILPRADPRDVLVQNTNGALAAGAKIGSSSPRRRAQLLAWRPDLQIVDIRGNLDTRLKKLDSGTYDALALAAAGLERLGYSDRIFSYLDPVICLPAVAQGAIGVEIRARDQRLRELLAPLNDHVSAASVTAERAFSARLGGGCFLPIAALATAWDDELHLIARIAHPEGTQILERQVRGKLTTARNIGTEAAEQLLAAGGDTIVPDIA